MMSAKGGRAPEVGACCRGRLPVSSLCVGGEGGGRGGREGKRQACRRNARGVWPWDTAVVGRDDGLEGVHVSHQESIVGSRGGVTAMEAHAVADTRFPWDRWLVR